MITNEIGCFFVKLCPRIILIKNEILGKPFYYTMEFVVIPPPPQIWKIFEKKNI